MVAHHKPKEEVASCMPVLDVTCPFTKCGVRVTKEYFDKVCNSPSYLKCNMANQLNFHKNSDSQKTK